MLCIPAFNCLARCHRNRFHMDPRPSAMGSSEAPGAQYFSIWPKVRVHSLDTKQKYSLAISEPPSFVQWSRGFSGLLAKPCVRRKQPEHASVFGSPDLTKANEGSCDILVRTSRDIQSTQRGRTNSRWKKRRYTNLRGSVKKRIVFNGILSRGRKVYMPNTVRCDPRNRTSHFFCSQSLVGAKTNQTNKCEKEEFAYGYYIYFKRHLYN